jgi:hypothetical protein
MLASVSLETQHQMATTFFLKQVCCSSFQRLHSGRNHRRMVDFIETD